MHGSKWPINSARIVSYIVRARSDLDLHHTIVDAHPAVDFEQPQRHTYAGGKSGSCMVSQIARAQPPQHIHTDIAGITRVSSVGRSQP